MKLAGSYKLNVKKEIVWQALNDPDILKQCIPGCEYFEHLFFLVDGELIFQKQLIVILFLLCSP